MLESTDGATTKAQYEEPLIETCLSCVDGDKKKNDILVKFFPFLQWARTITTQDVCKDLLAGITVGVLLIPQSMSYAALAHLPPQYGLYTGFIPLIVFAFFTSSYHISIGPVAPVCVLIGDALIRIVGDDSIDPTTDFGNAKFQAAASGLSLVAGLILILMAILRLGFIVKYLSVPVMTGFVTGAAFIIFGNQLRGMFGLDCEKTSYFYSTFWNAVKALNTIHWYTTAVSMLSLTFLCGCKYFNAPRWFPAPFILMFVTTILSYYLDFENSGIKIVGDLPAGIPAPELPQIFGSSSVIIQGIVVAVVAYVGSLGLAKSLARDSPFPYEINANSELVAYGMSSVVGSFFSGFPPAASFSRSALAFEMQGRTPLHGIFTASLMCLALFLTVAFKYLPKCVLAVVIVMSVRRLFLNGWKELVYLGKARSIDFFECIICIIGVCVFGITEGIMLGAIVSFVSYIYGTSFAEISIKSPNEGLRSRQSSEGKEAMSGRRQIRQSSEGILGTGSAAGVPTGERGSRIASFSISMPKQQAVVIQPNAGVYYANVAKVADYINSSVKDIEDTLVLDIKYSPYLDSTSARGILDSLAEASKAIKNIIVSNCGDNVNKDLVRYARSESQKEVFGLLKIINRNY